MPKWDFGNSWCCLWEAFWRRQETTSGGGIERKWELIKTNKLTINVIAVVFFMFQFARHIKKSEGQKTPKVELQISIYGVKILDPKTKVRNSHGFFFSCSRYLFHCFYCFILKYYNKSHSVDGNKSSIIPCFVTTHGWHLPRKYMVVLRAHCS